MKELRTPLAVVAAAVACSSYSPSSWLEARSYFPVAAVVAAVAEIVVAKRRQEHHATAPGALPSPSAGPFAVQPASHKPSPDARTAAMRNHLEPSAARKIVVLCSPVAPASSSAHGRPAAAHRAGSSLVAQCLLASPGAADQSRRRSAASPARPPAGPVVSAARSASPACLCP